MTPMPGYKSQRLKLMQLLDELLSSGRSEHEAVTELIAALEDGVLPLVDGHQFPDSHSEVLAKAGRILRAWRDRGHVRQSQSEVQYESIYFKLVWIKRADAETVFHLSDVAPLPRKSRRYAGDDELAREGFKGIQTGKWPNQHQAAIALAPRAEGTSDTAKIDRLQRKISGLGKAPR